MVGATVQDPERLPEHLVVDEKHTWWLGEKHYLATTVGGAVFWARSWRKKPRPQA